MRVPVLVIAVVSILVGQALYCVPPSYGQTASTENSPMVAPVQQVLKTPDFTLEQKEKIREIVIKETTAWQSLVNASLTIGLSVLAIIVAVFIFVVVYAVKAIKHRAISDAEQAEKAREQAQKFVEEIRTIQDNAKKQAEEFFGEMKARGEQILEDLGKTFAHRPRYLITQGATIAEPVYEFDLAFLISTKGNSSVYGLLRTSGGSGFNGLTKEQKEQREEFTIALNDDKSITLERHLTGEHSGKIQKFKSTPGPAQKTLEGKTAMVWEGTWSGHGAVTQSGVHAYGAFMVYLD